MLPFLAGIASFLADKRFATEGDILAGFQNLQNQNTTQCHFCFNADALPMSSLAGRGAFGGGGAAIMIKCRRMGIIIAKHDIGIIHLLKLSSVVVAKMQKLEATRKALRRHFRNYQLYNGSALLQYR